MRFPLYLRVLVGVALGAIVGIIFRSGAIVGDFTTADLGRLGVLVVRLLKLLAVPLVAFAILDSIARTNVSGRMGLKLVLICTLNVSVAFTIGLTLMNTLEPGKAWIGHLDELTGLSHEAVRSAPPGTSLSFMDNLEKWIPNTAVQPFEENNVISVVLLAILFGIALRSVRNEEDPDDSVGTVLRLVAGGYRVLVRTLGYVIDIVPFAVFCLVAQVAGKANAAMLGVLGSFLGIILVGFVLHAGVYYTSMAWFVGRKSPRVYLGKGANAIVTGLSTNSSLATVPVTLSSLDAMGVSQESSRLAALIGTNLNNDGITLYEAMTALFLAQALGYDLSMGEQMTVVGASLMAGIGIAGIPEAGLIVLPLVLAAVGLPETVVAALIPIVFTVDWILARCRSAVNVMSDMLVAILLERWRPR